MASTRKEYRSESIVVSFDARICIHAAECVRGLPQVFDTNRRPWIKPDEAAADRIAEVVLRCPTGALHFERLDGGPVEPIPAETTLTVVADGPIYVRGNVEVTNANGALIRKDTRLALCRCGHSANKPFCDGTHSKVGFHAE